MTEAKQTDAGTAAVEAGEVYTFPLSSAQQMLWLAAQMGVEGPVYHVPTGYRLNGPLDARLLERALRGVVARHEVLRTTIAVVDGEPAQVVSPEAHLTLEVVDLQPVPAGDREPALAEHLDEEARRPFDLVRGPLFRATLFRLAPERHTLLVNVHHLVWDGWSDSIFVRELGVLYDAFAVGEESPLDELPIQYGDYAHWERDALQGEELERVVGWWRERLAGAPEALELPTDRPHPAEPTHRGAVHPFSVSAAASARLATLAREEGTTTFGAVLAGFGTLLHRLSGQGEVLVGTPVANRGQVELEGLIGPFMNTVVLRLDLGGDPTFRELLGRVRETIHGMQEHQELPFDRLVSELAPRREFNRTPLFQVMLNFAEAGRDGAAEERSGLVPEPFGVQTGTAKFDLQLNALSGPEGIACTLEYATDLFDAETIERMAGHCRALLEAVAQDPARRLSTLPLLEEAERERLLGQWSGSGEATPGAHTVHEAVEALAAAHPRAEALVCGSERLSYAELNARANRLARHLRRRGVGPEVRVGVLLERSLELPVALLAVLKAGGAYVPLDPAFPSERLAFVLADAGAPLLLTREALRERAPATLGVVTLDAEAAQIAGDDASDLERSVGPEHLACVIYTSGSTGEPKGSMVPHRAVAGYAGAYLDLPPGSGPETWMQYSSLSWDALTLELWTPLLRGARCVLFEAGREGGISLEALGREIAEQGVTTLWMTASLFNAVLESVPAALAPLRVLMTGGEALSQPHVWRALERFPELRLVNGYGPSECTVFSACKELSGDLPLGPVSIGRPVGDRRVYVLDAGLEPAPVGVPGELYVGGPAVARGYLDRPGLTAEKFVPDPFGGDPGARLYRTGDRVRWLGTGELEFVGRADQQVKVRGYRIEPGEIEQVLLGHPGVREAAILVCGEGEERRLVAYVCSAGDELAGGTLRAFLAARLPDYMVPGAVLVLDAFPLTPNGKLDRAALPMPGEGRFAVEEAYTAPHTLVEETLAAIWAAVLRVESVGVHDNFYALGGDSIRILRVVAVARERGIRIAISDVARNPTIAALAAAADVGGDGPEEEIHTKPFSLISAEDRERLPADVEDAYPLARLQLGMLYHRESTPDSSMYHVLDSWRFRMSLDEEAFRRAVLYMAARHPGLRTSFDLESYSEPLQLVHRDAVFPVECHDLRHLPEAEHDRLLSEFFAVQQALPFDLARAPQLRLHVHRRRDDTVQFTLVVNHALFDGWSLNTVLSELLTCYLAQARGEEVRPFPELTTTYRDFVRLERRALESGEAREFWAARLEGYEQVPLPRGPERDAPPMPRVHSGVHLLRRPLVRGLREVARRESVPLKSILLAAHFKVLAVLGGRSDVVSGLSTNGRPETVDGERVCGLFLNTVPLRADLSPGSWSELVLRVHEAELAALPYRRYPLSAIQADRGGAGPLFDASFVYLNFHMVAEHLQSGDLVPLGADAAVGETNFAIMTAFQHVPGRDGRFVLSVECDRQVFSDRRIREIDALYLRVLEALAADPEGAHASFSALSPEARLQVLKLGVGGGAAPLDAPVHVLFARHAAADPARPFLVWSGGTLSRGQVDAPAGELAGRLRALGVVPGSRVAVVMDRAPEAVVALLAAWKAGAAYVPVDPAYPPERLAWVLRDADVSAVVTLERWRGPLAGVPVPVVALDAPGRPAASRMDGPPAEADPGALAYVVYTSGTTGRPKGVMVDHEQVMHYTAAVRARLDVPADASWLLLSTFAADLGNTALFPALAGGGVLHVASDREAGDPAALELFLADHPVDALKVVPSHLRALLAHDAPGRLLPRTHMVLGGAAADWALVARVRALAPGCRVFNHYGPTETTVGAVAGELDLAPRDAAPPLGRPLGHARAYVLDAHGHPAPAGTPGELYLGGAGVARGYLGNPALTAARFLPDPFSPTPGARLYRSGDRARWLEDGRLDFLGRADGQVKVRGFRVEPGEVETALRLHPGVETAAVVARADDGEVRLAAYVVGLPGVPTAEADLRCFVEARLPAYMIPTWFVRLEALPLTANGKVDHARLPAPGAPGVRAAADGLPRTGAEAQVVELWKAVLKVERVGVHDGFVELGGDSIKAILLAARIRKTFGVPISVETLLGAQSPAGLAGSIEMASHTREALSAPPIVPVPRDGDLPLSFAQQRLWYTTLLDPASPAHNIPFTLRLRGALDVGAWRASLEEIVCRHEVLRSRFPTVEGEPRQVIDPPGAFALREVDLRDLPPETREAALAEAAQAEAWSPFDLERGPLARAALVRVDEEDFGAVIVFHHIVFDGWSAGVLVSELAALYASFGAGRPSPLPELAVQYADFAAWQREQLRDEELEGQLAWWKERLAGVPALELPADHPRPESRSLRGGSESAALSLELAQALRDVSRREGVTPFMCLLAGYAAVLGRESGQDDFAVGCPVAVHRDRPELHGVIGVFLNSLPIRVDLAGAPSFRELLLRVRRQALDAYTHQGVPFERVVEALRLPRDPGRAPLFQVWFNHSAVPGDPVTFGGLDVEWLDAGDPAVKFDLRLGTGETTDGGLVMSLGYAADLFEAGTARRLLARLVAFLSRAVAAPEQPLGEIHAALDDEERAEQSRRASGREASLRRHLQGARRRAVEIEV